MKRAAGAMMLLAALGGCVTTDTGAPWASSGGGASCPGGSASCASGGGPKIPGVQGPWGQPVAMAAPYSSAPPQGEAAARAMMSRSMPMDLVQTAGMMDPNAGSGIQQANNWHGNTLPGAVPLPAAAISPPGVPFGPGGPTALPPTGPGAVAAVGALINPTPNRFSTKRTEVRFVGPAGMKIAWYAPNPSGKSNFTAAQLEAPGRYNFVQAALYRLKLSDIPNRPGLELYPTLEVVPSNAKADPFLAHSAVPVSFTEEDFDQVAAGNFLVKVVYLPDPQYQDVASTGPDEVVSTRLEPGADPIAEAYKRGNILLVVRMGNIDLEAPNTPAMDAPSPYMLRPPAQPAAPQQHGAGQLPNLPVPGAGGPMGGMPQGMLTGRSGQLPAPPTIGGQVPQMGPNGMPIIQTPYGAVMISPNGPMTMGPNGPVPLTVEQQRMLFPNIVGPGPNPGAAEQGAPAQPQLPSTLSTQPTVPVSQLPDAPVAQTQYTGPTTTTTSAPVAAPAAPTMVETKAKPAPQQKKWLFGN